MDMEEAIEFYYAIEKKDIEDKIYLRWVAGPQFHIGFKEFCEKLKPIKMLPEEEVIEHITEIFREKEAANERF